MAPGGGIADILGSKGGRPKGGLGGGGGPLIMPNGGGGGRRSGGGPRMTVLGGGAGLGKRKACCRAILKEEIMENLIHERRLCNKFLFILFFLKAFTRFEKD